jgi:hypothetical protein
MQQRPVKFMGFPETLPTLKRLILIEENIVGLTEKTFQTAQSDEAVIDGLLTHNIETFLRDKEKYPIDDSFREKLLASGISDSHKLSIIEDIDPAMVIASATIAEKIGSIFSRIDMEFTEYDYGFIQMIIGHTKPLAAKIALFNKCHKELPLEQVRQVIGAMPEPFPDLLSVGWRSPKIPNTPENRTFVNWLEKRRIISSSSITLFDEIRINTFRK